MPQQMALDELLFQETIEARAAGLEPMPLLRFYYASEPWISVGYSYAGWREGSSLAPEAADGRVPACRRITGGGTVLHGNDLMFTLVASREDHESFKSVRLSYLRLHEIVKNAVESLGLPVRFYRCDQPLAKGKECFVFPIATDLEACGRKIAGGGQKRSLGVMLHQESIQLPKRTLDPALVTALQRSFAEGFNTRLEPADFDPQILFQAEKLGEAKYLMSGSKLNGTAGKHQPVPQEAESLA